MRPQRVRDRLFSSDHYKLSKRSARFDELRSGLQAAGVEFIELDRTSSDSVEGYGSTPSEWDATELAKITAFSLAAAVSLPLLFVLNALNERTGNPRFVELQQAVVRRLPFSEPFVDREAARSDRDRLKQTAAELKETSGREPVAIIENDGDL